MNIKIFLISLLMLSCFYSYSQECEYVFNDSSSVGDNIRVISLESQEISAGFYVIFVRIDNNYFAYIEYPKELDLSYRDIDVEVHFVDSTSVWLNNDIEEGLMNIIPLLRVEMDEYINVLAEKEVNHIVINDYRFYISYKKVFVYGLRCLIPELH